MNVKINSSRFLTVVFCVFITTWSKVFSLSHSCNKHINVSDINYLGSNYALEKAFKDGVKVFYDNNEFNHLDQTYKGIIGILKEVISIAPYRDDNTLLTEKKKNSSNVLGTFSSLVLDDYHIVNGSATPVSIWNVIKDRIDILLQTRLSSEHFDSMKEHFLTWQALFRSGPEFNYKDLLRIVNYKEEMFPQHESLQYSPYWSQSMITWIINVVAGYLEIRRYQPKESCKELKTNTCLGQCALANELIVIRYDVIQAIQALYKRRYQSIVGVAATTVPVVMVKEKVYNKKNVDSLLLQFKDETTGVKYPEVLPDAPKRGNIKKVIEMLDVLIKRTHDVAELLFDFFNNLVEKFDETKIFCGCQNIPTSISNFFSDKYNSRFYGTSREKNSTCKLPCTKYGYFSNDYWCPSGKILQNDKNYGKAQLVGENKNWALCNPPNFDTVIPTVSTLPSWLMQKEIPKAAIDTGLLLKL